ncbi:golgin subfamily A member 6-like protein 22 isoform X3 [Cervus canadensis]|uniref:golgin subfamily A member 6-like protein 22 isoform X3 n=1 Tax=Cervus canadensis TaxID=1574408 RepID=UPI001C9E848D|nr:golgin subfamily A member 6-like protein 22 isoform X3 [Cervus canadensis]
MNKDGILHDTEKTSAAEQYKREAAKREKDSLEQKVKELLQMLESQGRAFKIFRVKITGEMRERDNLLRRMNKRIEMLEILRKIKKEQEECFMKKEEQIKREASEREKDPSELKVQELQRKLENQKRVLERLRARMRKEIREREKTSAAEEWARGEATEREKEPLEQKVKASQSKMEGDQSVFLKGVRLQTTKKMRERENLLRRIKERCEMLEILGMIKDELGECCKKTDELLCDSAKILAECPEGEPSEREKELLEQKYKEIHQKVEDQKKDFEEFGGKMIEEIGKRQKISVEERAKREAAEREKELLEQKVKELQEQLEDQERVSEEFRVKKTEKRRERKKTSAEMLVQWKIAMWQKKLLEQKVKELQQKLEDQERTFERFRVILTKEMREKDDLLRKMNERIQMLEHLLRLPEKLEEHDMKKEEQAKREATERENEPLAQKVKELQQKSENQERVFEVLRVKMTEELNERKKASAEEQIKREATEREKESLEKQVEELQQNLEDQERVFQRLRTEMTEEMRESEKASAEEQIKREATEREKESLEKQVEELQQNLEDQERVFQRLRTVMTEEMRESEKASAGKQAKRKAAEREKKLLEQKLKELQQKFEYQERAFKAFRVQITEEVREGDNFLRKMNERIEMLEAAVNNDNDKDNEENIGKD